MTEQHPITPPPELLHQWATEYWGNPGESIGEGEKYIATQAARWGADQELAACVEWVVGTIPSWAPHTFGEQLREARRPKPPSPKEEALQVLENLIEARRIIDPEYQALRHALEQLHD